VTLEGRDRQALEQGTIDLKGYAVVLLAGQTTVEEVTSVVSIDA
jgi:hypothetical protein